MNNGLRTTTPADCPIFHNKCLYVGRDFIHRYCWFGFVHPGVNAIDEQSDPLEYFRVWFSLSMYGPVAEIPGDVGSVTAEDPKVTKVVGASDWSNLDLRSRTIRYGDILQDIDKQKIWVRYGVPPDEMHLVPPFLPAALRAKDERLGLDGGIQETRKRRLESVGDDSSQQPAANNQKLNNDQDNFAQQSSSTNTDEQAKA